MAADLGPYCVSNLSVPAMLCVLREVAGLYYRVEAAKDVHEISISRHDAVLGPSSTLKRVPFSGSRKTTKWDGLGPGVNTEGAPGFAYIRATSSLFLEIVLPSAHTVQRVPCTYNAHYNMRAPNTHMFSFGIGV